MQIEAASLTAVSLFSGMLTMGRSSKNIEANSNPIKLIGSF
jgi:hypothetical protein